MNPKGREMADAIRREVELWPGVTVEIVEGGKHPKAKYFYLGNMLARPFAGTTGDSAFGVHQMLGDVRRVLKQLGAQRDKPEPSREEDEAPYRKPNEGRALRPDPIGREPVEPKPDLVDQLVDKGLITPERAAQSRHPSEPHPLDGAEVEDEEVAGPDAEAILLAAELIEDGIYFDLDDRIYHAVPRMSASGLQRLCVSPGTFWKHSWLNPEGPQPDEQETEAQRLGKAYHCARLEPERFHSSYCRLPDKASFGRNLISSDTAIKAELKALGETQSIGNESSVERAERLVDAGCEKPIWALVMAEHLRERAGRIPIEAKHYDQIIQDMERIRGHGEIGELLVGGQSEVSVFWTDENGLPCKCRFDYLTLPHWVEFKTFDNSRGKILEQALADAVRYNRYYVQAVHYRDGAEAIRTAGLQIKGEANDDQRALVAAIQIRPEELTCEFIFQEKKGVPNIVARQFCFFDVPLSIESSWDTGASEEARARGHDATRTMTGIHARGAVEIRHAKDQFVLYSNAYNLGTPWFPLAARARFSDLDFSSYWLEGKI